MGLFGKSKGSQEVSFDIVFEMLAKTHTLTRDCIKRYYEAKFGECEDKKLDKVLSKFDKVEKSETWYRLNSKQYDKYLAQKVVVRSSIKKDEIFDIGFKPFKDKVKANVEEIIRSLPQNAKINDFNDEIEKYKSSLRLPFDNNIPMPLIFSTAVAEIVADYLITGNRAVISFVTRQNIRFLFDLNREQEFSYCAFALRALNYKNSAADKDEYKSITKEDCLEAAKACGLFEQEDNKAYIADIILKAPTFSYSDGGRQMKNWNSMMCEIDVAVDAACFHTWKTLCDICDEEANELKEIINLLTGYINSKK